MNEIHSLLMWADARENADIIYVTHIASLQALLLVLQSR